LRIIPWQRYISLTTQNGGQYYPTNGAELTAILRQIEQDGDKISVLIIKGHGDAELIETGPELGDQLVAYDQILIGEQDVTTTLRNITGPGSQIKLRGCNTRPLADKVENKLDNGTEVYGSLTYIIGVPGTPWGIGAYR